MFPLNCSSAGLALMALKARGVSAASLAAAIGTAVSRAAAMLRTHDATLRVAEAKAVEKLTGTTFVALCVEGLYIRHRDEPAKIAELDEMRSTLFANLKIRVPTPARRRPMTTTPAARPAPAARARRIS